MRSDEFIDMYKQLEDALELKYKNARRRYSGVVMEFTRDYESTPVRDKLEICREIRNLLTHTAKLGGQTVVEPSEQVLEALRDILSFVKEPPKAIEYATKAENLLKVNLNQKVLRVMEVMDKNGFSHVPVMNNGELVGVFSVGTVFKYFLKSGGSGIEPETRIADLGSGVSIDDHIENYEFVPKDESYLAVRKRFEIIRGKNKRISVVFITENGKRDERLLGMITPLDVLDSVED